MKHMQIDCMHPEKISWRLDISSYKDPLEPFGEKTRKRIIKTKKLHEGYGYVIKCEDFSEDIFNKFLVIYKHHIKRIGGILHDVKDKIITNPRHNFPYKFINAYKNGKYQGGIIFSDRVEHLVVAYRAIPHELEIKLPINLSYVMEYYLNKYALESGKKYIRRGRDRNPYGLNLSIGLALYKLQLGNYPILVPNQELTIIHCFDWKEEDTLVFLPPTKGDRINMAIMYSSKNNDELKIKYTLLFTNKYVTVDIINPRTSI